MSTYAWVLFYCFLDCFKPLNFSPIIQKYYNNFENFLIRNFGKNFRNKIYISSLILVFLVILAHSAAQIIAYLPAF